MRRCLAVAAVLLATACSKPAAPVASDEAAATAAAERKAVADTDGARRDAGVTRPAEQSDGGTG